ncbi:hypothetical protein QJS66_12180 [Kocuria rhizophila]|nr:hypothetical protein QJS66_12180 [Kocuria rhizophila]
MADAAEARAFAEEHGLPIAIKAAFGGGGRGRASPGARGRGVRVDAAVREATTAFGRGEVLRGSGSWTARATWQAQVVADTHGNVVVDGHARLLAAAPSPEARGKGGPGGFLTDEQRTTLHESARAICREAGYTVLARWRPSWHRTG